MRLPLSFVFPLTWCVAAGLLLTGCQAVRLSDERAAPFDFRDFVAAHEVVAVVFLAADCPISQKQVLTLNQLAERFPQVKLVGVFTKWDQWDDVHRFQRTYLPRFPLWRDGEMRLVRHLRATVTPEAFCLKKGKVAYQGAVDNWFVALGRYRPEPTEHYLRDALEAALAGQSPQVKVTKPIGCLIEH